MRLDYNTELNSIAKFGKKKTTKGDVGTLKELHTSVVSLSVATMFKGFLKAHDEGIDGVGSIHDEIKVVARMKDLSLLRALISVARTSPSRESVFP